MARPTIDDRLTRPRHRRGLSYLEVLIAAGIGLAGLLGAIAIFPVAILNMQRGVVADTTAYIGPSALEQAQAMGINRPKTWIDAATTRFVEVATPPPPVPPNPSTHAARPELGGRIWDTSITAWDGFCFDPRFVAEFATISSSNASQYSASSFPYYAKDSTSPATDVRMRRATLGNGMGGSMGVNQARLLFKVSDDLITLKPDDKTAPATLSPLFGKSNTPVRRDYMGDFEWIITATPQIVYDPGIGGQLRNTGMYQLSVVVFHQRSPRLDTIIDTTGTTNVEDERLVDVQFLSDGISGGDVIIQTRPGRPDSDLEVREGQWVMLSAMIYSQPGVTSPPAAGFTPIGPLFQWYRVAAVQGDNDNANRRYLTLEGPDWPVQSGANLTPIPVLGSGQLSTRMTIISGVVGVFQHAIKIEP